MSASRNADRLPTLSLRSVRQAQSQTRQQQEKPKPDFGTYGKGLEDAFAQVFGGR